MVVSNLISKILSGGHPWGFGEWLINYQAGFVRRGFVGQLAIALFNGIEILWFVFILQITIYVIIVWYLIAFLKRNEFSWFSILLVCSPFGIAMIANDANLFIRKENLGLLLLIIVGHYSRSKYFGIKVIELVVSLVYFVTILASEVNLFFFPVIIYIYLQNSRNIRKSEKIFFISFLTFIHFIGLFLVIKFHGSIRQSSSICKSLVNAGLDEFKNCPGAIETLSLPLKEAITHLRVDYPANLIFLPIVCLSLLPFIRSGIFHAKPGLLFTVLIGVTPLFFIAWDYGRWIYMIYMQILFAFIELSYEKRFEFKPNYYFVIIYCMFLGIGHTDGNLINNGWIALIPSILRGLSSIFG